MSVVRAAACPTCLEHEEDDDDDDRADREQELEVHGRRCDIGGWRAAPDPSFACRTQLATGAVLLLRGRYGVGRLAAWSSTGRAPSPTDPASARVVAGPVRSSAPPDRVRPPGRAQPRSRTEARTKVDPVRSP